MALRLTVENVTNLPDGGPTSFAVTSTRSVDIGRDPRLDWTLPDPSRYISSKHCEIHHRNGNYWLHDVSTNGTFLNGADQRMRSPHQLRSGDRLVIGHYIIAVLVDEESASLSQETSPVAIATKSQAGAAYPELWTLDREVPPPVDRRQLMTPREAARPVNPEFLDWAAGVPEVDMAPGRLRPPEARAEHNVDMDWTSGPSRSLEAVEPALPIAAPRRPLWTDEAAGSSTPASAPPLTRPEQVPNPPPRAESDPRSGFGIASGAGAAGVPPDRTVQDMIYTMARAAGLPENFFAGADTARLAHQLGELMRIAVGDLMALLQARNEAKRLTRSTTHTAIQATENNPLKFSPTPEDAMRILFGPKTDSYMDARSAFEQGFADLKMHQLKTYAAMQHAVSMLIADLDPAAIARDVTEHEGFMDRLRSRKGRSWDAFLIRWKASLGREPGAAIEAFMLHFADYYDQDGRDAAQ